MNLQKIKNCFKSLILILLLLYFSSIFFALFNIDPEKISITSYTFYLFISNLILVGIFVYIYRRTLQKDFQNFIKDLGNNMETSIKYWLIGFGIMALSNIFITFILKKSIAGNEEQIRSLVAVAPLFMIFDVVIYAPLTEELIFRKSFKDIFSNKWLFVIISGLVFGGLHIINYINNISDFIYLIPYCSLGIMFALLYYKTDNIFSTISMHALHNALAIIIYFLGAGL